MLTILDKIRNASHTPLDVPALFGVMSRFISAHRMSAKVISMTSKHGRPYDYNFDYLTDNSLVCTELLFKAYEPGVEAPGLKLPLEKIGKHLVTPANAFARQFSQTYNTDRQQMDLVLFMDGYEKSHSAVRSDVSTFLTNWKRPKWHIIQQTLQSRKP